ncbi:MAG: hypothetical protein ABSG10_08485 [Terracidiphilus sp.]|jgi:hypothetical protein
MKRLLIISGAAVLCFALGALAMYSVMRLKKTSVPDPWISVTDDDGGFRLELDAMRPDIPIPNASRPTGQVKFLSRDRGLQIGYKITLPIKPVPVSSLPAKYQRETKLENGLIEGPPSQVQYNGHFDFTLEDADGFVLAKVSAPPEWVSAGSDNKVQGTTEDVVSQSVAEKTKRVLVGYLVVSCNPCSPDSDGHGDSLNK